MEQWTVYLPTVAAALVALVGYLVARTSASRLRARIEVSRTMQSRESELEAIHDEMERAQSTIAHSIQEALATLEKMQNEVRDRETAGSL